MLACAQRSSVTSVSSVSSVSLLEVKAETHLVLQAFLHRTVSVPQQERPGRVGGAYIDHNKYSYKPKPKSQEEDAVSPSEDVPSAEDKRPGLKELIKQLPRHNLSYRFSKDRKGSVNRETRTKPLALRDQIEDDVISPSSTSEDDDSERKPKKGSQKRFRKKLSRIFKLRLEREKDKKDAGAFPQRPSALPISIKPEQPHSLISPNHPPEFFDEVAEKLDHIAHTSASIKRVIPPPSPPPVCDKEAIVQQLVHLLSLEGDAINTKIQSDPFLRKSLARLSYSSFTKVLDTFSHSQVPEAPPQSSKGSPTLRRMAVTMEVSRRMVTATGTQRVQGMAERYMETFAQWVKHLGGWENAVLDDHDEYN